MVSTLWVVALSFAMAQALPAAAPQSNTAQNSFRDDSKTGPEAAQPQPARLISPEMRGDIFMARKQYREAAEAYKDGPMDSAVLLNKTGIAYHQMMQLGTAAKYYRLAIKTNPQYAEAINNLGAVFYADKSFRRAVNEYKKALRINPNSASMWSNLCTGYWARKDYKRANEALEKALAIDPDVFETRSTQGVVLQERSFEERAKFHYLMAQRYAKDGRSELALLYIRKALEEGLKERKKIEDDPAFAQLKETPEFKELMALEPRVL
jgi:tetratricopeptide (TPR) repeat protein